MKIENITKAAAAAELIGTFLLVLVGTAVATAAVLGSSSPARSPVAPPTPHAPSGR